MADADALLDRTISFLESHRGQRVAVLAYAMLTAAVLPLFPGTSLAIVVGIPALFFLPGFAVVRLVFWKGTSIEAKFVLSLGLSILVVIFLGLFLVLTPIGLRSETTISSLVLFILAALALELFWRPAGEGGEAPEQKERKLRTEPFKIDKVVAAMLATALVVSAISIGLVITAEYPSRTYFALTDEDGSANINLTRDLGTDITLIVHMHNGEDGPRDFIMVAYSNETSGIPTAWYNSTLERGEDWNVTIAYDLLTEGVWVLHFDLYIQEEGHDAYFYANLHVWISVS
ncbi:MAG: DUF1616 domain-containing protein [Thermoplasmata archaeon]|nr:DUF1616 domain-containing protein [Thermoplasmata archaeon]